MSRPSFGIRHGGRAGSGACVEMVVEEEKGGAWKGLDRCSEEVWIGVSLSCVTGCRVLAMFCPFRPGVADKECRITSGSARRRPALWIWGCRSFV